MILIYLEILIGVPIDCVLEPLQDLLLALTAASLDCPVVHLHSDCGEIWMSVDEAKIHMDR